MATKIKAIVFRTSQLKATKEFFTAKLGFIIKESSVTHFVIHSKSIRILFIESKKDFEVELYLSSKVEQSVAKDQGLKKCEAPNGIKIIISDYHYEGNSSNNKK